MLNTFKHILSKNFNYSSYLIIFILTLMAYISSNGLLADEKGLTPFQKTENSAKTLIRGGTIVTMNPNRDVLYKQDILVVGNRIQAIGDLSKEYDSVDKVIDANGQIIIPGLIQTHLHLSQTLFRNLAADKNLEQWLDVILRLQAALDKDSNYWSSMLGIAELFLGGTTAIYDMNATHYVDSAFEAIEKTGMRGFSGKRMTDILKPGYPEKMVQSTDVAFKESVDLFQKWDGRAGGRIQYCFCPGSVDECTEELLKLTSDFSAKYQARVQTHAAESKDVAPIVLKRTGMSEVAYLNSLGLINPRTVLAHCVHVSPSDIDLVAKGGAHVAHCPTSNLFLASGIAPTPSMIDKGINIGMGSDNAADNTNLDTFKELQLAALLQKGLHANPTIQPSAQRAFEMATLGGAKALGLEEEIGSIETGKKADLAILDFRKPHTWPNESEVNSKDNIYTRIVYSAMSSDVVLTMVDGQIVMQDRKLLTMDLNEVLEKSNAAIIRLLSITQAPL